MNPPPLGWPRLSASVYYDDREPIARQGRTRARGLTGKSRLFHLRSLGFAVLISADAWATPVPLNWVSANGTVAVGSTLSRVDGNAFSDTAVGSVALASGAGYLEFSTAETDRAKAAGLGSRDNNGGLEAIDFGFLLRADGTVAVLEKGVVVQSAGAYSAGDLFRVGVEGSAIVFRSNGSLVRTSALAFAYPLFAEATLADAGATISNAQVDGTTAETVVWAGATKANALPGFLSKTTAVSAWDSGAASTMALDGSSDGYVEVQASLGPTTAMVGLSHGNNNAGYSDIDYALYMASGTLYIYEGGVNRGSFGALSANDRLAVFLESGTVKYRKNGTLVYTSLVPPTFPLLVDSSLRSSGARITGAILWNSHSGGGVQADVLDRLRALPERPDRDRDGRGGLDDSLHDKRSGPDGSGRGHRVRGQSPDRRRHHAEGEGLGHRSVPEQHHHGNLQVRCSEHRGRDLDRARQHVLDRQHVVEDHGCGGLGRECCLHQGH